MSNELPGMTLKAIGIVRSEINQPSRQDCREIVSDIIIDSSLTEALDNLDDFSHIIVLYWMHQVPPLDQVPTKIHPRGRYELPLVGLFATRAPYRPNPLGMTTVRLMQRQGNILKVKGLDAVDGTPVIDIKPYIPGYDLVVNAGVPSWMNKR